MASRISFGVVCLCGLEEANAQLRRVFSVENDSMLQAIKNVLREDFITAGHVHDGAVLERFFIMVVQATGKIYKAVQLADTFLQERYKEGMRAEIQSIQPQPKEGFIADIFDAEAVGRKQKVAEALGLYRVGLEQNMTVSFANFVGNHGNLFSASQVERVNVHSEGLLYFANWM
ncbi:hypothetical protein SUGI_0436120 [Cryptomeria japonica]|nr:hypothetical protein SUGI_0436120 [Cryptomeria japonica]